MAVSFFVLSVGSQFSTGHIKQTWGSDKKYANGLALSWAMKPESVIRIKEEHSLALKGDGFVVSPGDI